jgi:hypothetical protein
MSPESKNRKLYVTKVIPKAEGRKIWKLFEKEYERRKKVFKAKRPQSPRYIG